MVYADPTVTDVACQGLNGLKMGDRVLTVRRATEVWGVFTCLLAPKDADCCIEACKYAGHADEGPQAPGVRPVGACSV